MKVDGIGLVRQLSRQRLLLAVETEKQGHEAQRQQVHQRGNRHGTVTRAFKTGERQVPVPHHHHRHRIVRTAAVGHEVALLRPEQETALPR